MLTETNLGGIIASVKQWSQRKNISDDIINDFVELALSKATRALRIPPLEAVQYLEVLNNGYAEIPYDFQEAKEVYVYIGDKRVILERKTISEVDAINNNAGSGDAPCYFARYGNFLRIAPWTWNPDDDDEQYFVQLYYYKIIPPMSDEASENWFTLYAPEVLLYGAMTELCGYTRDNEGTALWASKFNDAINIIQQVEDRAEWRGSTISVSITGSNPI